MPPINSKLGDKLKGLKNPHAARKEPLWTGPNGEGSNGGVTQGLLARFLTCRERTRLMLVEGIKHKEGFNARIEYGSMWHVCEEALAAEVEKFGEQVGTTLGDDNLLEYCQQLRKRFPFSQEEIAHWRGMCREFFPLYVEHWRNHPDVLERTPLLQEYMFDVPYQLPSGRTVRLRGKWDSVDLIGSGKGAGIFLQENKTKSTIKQEALLAELGSGFELQTMFYLTALDEAKTTAEFEQGDDVQRLLETAPLSGVRYNVIRRPAHKTAESALKKFHEDADNNRLGEWFARFKVVVRPADIERFRRQCLDPVLENLCDWWECLTRCSSDNPYERCRKHGSTLWRTPYFYNPLSEGAPTDLDHYVDGGNMAGLDRVDVLYPELA
jgi:hypothetical protein